MNRNVLIVGTLVFLLAVFGAIGVLMSKDADMSGTGDTTYCAADVRECPDGSFVSRKPPSCDFAACPVVQATSTSSGGGGGILPYQSGVRGVVMLGPTCPVVKNPPDSACADKPYATTVTVRRANFSTVFASVKSDATGTFEFSLPPGDYVVSALGGNTLPRCPDTSVTVGLRGYQTVTIACDTGIR